MNDTTGYKYNSPSTTCAHEYLVPAVISILTEISSKIVDRKCFDLGCGNGSIANELYKLGWEVTGVDPSTEGIKIAREHFPHLDLHNGSAYDNLQEEYGRYSVVISLEVVEHVYSPRIYAKTLYDLVEPGGYAIVSTPYHSYVKNLALAVTGKMDNHFTALWDHGHIKFWSMKSLRKLMIEAGFSQVDYVRVGRIPILAKSMIAILKK